MARRLPGQVGTAQAGRRCVRWDRARKTRSARPRRYPDAHRHGDFLPASCPAATDQGMAQAARCGGDLPPRQVGQPLPRQRARPRRGTGALPSPPPRAPGAGRGRPPRAGRQDAGLLVPARAALPRRHPPRGRRRPRTVTCRDAALAAWAAELGSTARVLQSPGTTVVRHGPAFVGQRVAFALATETACVVTVPDDWYAPAEAALGHLGAAEAFDPTRLAGLFAPADPRGTRPLSNTDRAALDALAAACPPGEWEASSIDPERPPVFGRLVGGALVAAGTLAPWRERFWNVGIVTHPEHRGRGHGRAVVSAMTRHGLDQGWLLHYQTLLANVPSVAVARSLGYQQHANTLAIRLIPA